jgi:hypothetical protein
VRRWLASSPSGSDAAWAWALLPVGVVVGVAAEGAGFSWDDPERWVPDLVVGLTFIGAGAYALPRQRGCGALLAATGLTWFAGTVDVSALYLHRGPLVQLLVAVEEILASVSDDTPQSDIDTQRAPVPVDSGADKLAVVVQMLHDERIALDDVGVRRPSLDEVFLTLTGEPLAASGHERGDPAAA